MDNLIITSEIKNLKYLKDIKDELHMMNTFLGHLCKVMDALLVESDNTMRDANVRVDYDPRLHIKPPSISE